MLSPFHFHFGEFSLLVFLHVYTDAPVSTCLCMCVIMCARVYVQMSKPMVDFRSLSPVFCILFTEAGYLSGSQSPQDS